MTLISIEYEKELKPVIIGENEEWLYRLYQTEIPEKKKAYLVIERCVESDFDRLVTRMTHQAVRNGAKEVYVCDREEEGRLIVGKAYGYYKKNGNPDEVITLGYFPAHILPGTVTIHKGTIIRGANSFAGMTGFLPYNISRKEQLAKLEPGTCIPFITQALCAVIVLLNPGLVVLTGSLIDEGMLETVRQRCGADIPREYMPEFRIVDSFEQYYCEGMYQTAVDKKEI